MSSTPAMRPVVALALARARQAASSIPRRGGESVWGGRGYSGEWKREKSVG